MIYLQGIRQSTILKKSTPTFFFFSTLIMKFQRKISYQQAAKVQVIRKSICDLIEYVFFIYQMRLESSLKLLNF